MRDADGWLPLIYFTDPASASDWVAKATNSGAYKPSAKAFDVNFRVVPGLLTGIFTVEVRYDGDIPMRSVSIANLVSAPMLNPLPTEVKSPWGIPRKK